MYYTIRFGVLFLLLALFASANLAYAQIRDAGSKIQGNYDRFEQPSNIRSGPVYPLRGGAVEASQANRAFSYDPQAQPVPCQVAPATAPRATTQAAPAPPAVRQLTQSVRRFSYEPGFAAPTRSYVPSRNWQSGVRDAGSKVRGDY